MLAHRLACPQHASLLALLQAGPRCRCRVLWPSQLTSLQASQSCMRWVRKTYGLNQDPPWHSALFDVFDAACDVRGSYTVFELRLAPRFI